MRSRRLDPPGGGGLVWSSQTGPNKDEAILTGPSGPRSDPVKGTCADMSLPMSLEEAGQAVARAAADRGYAASVELDEASKR